jgi:predicted RNase H-like HicB family nuclease
MKAIEDFLALNYRISVYRDEDGDYVVEVDDLPGCVAHGSTPDEAFQDLQEAKRVWMESRIAAGLEIPEPRPIEDYSGRVLLRMPRWLHRRLAVQSHAEGASLNQHIVTLLSDASARQEMGLRQPVQASVVVGETSWPLVWSSQYVGLSQPVIYEVRREAFCQRLQAGMLAGLFSQGEARVASPQVGKPVLQEDGIEEGVRPFPGA